MNKQYDYIDGNVIISNENGVKKTEKYYDNLDEVLVKENVIETIEDGIETLKKKKRGCQWKHPKFKIVFPFIFSTIGSLTTPTLAQNFLVGNNPIVDTIFGPMSISSVDTIVMSVIIIPIGMLISTFAGWDYKNDKKTEKAIDSELIYLEKTLEEEKTNLEELKKEKSNHKQLPEGFQTVKVDDKSALQELRNYLTLYSNYGYYENKFLKYYQKGILEKKLQKYYTDSEIEAIKEYIEEKESTIVKKIGSR